MFKTLFHFDLGGEIVNGQAHIGKLNNENVIAYVATGGKVNIYNINIDNNKKIQSLNFNKEITCIAFMNNENEENKEKKDNNGDVISSSSSSSLLLLGSSSQLIAFDLLAASEKFEKEVNEGVFCLCAGKFGGYGEIGLAGGVCSVLGVDAKGNDVFWTVLGGNAVCMELGDMSGDGVNELLVGTDDFSIRVYSGESVINEINENTKITIVRPLEKQFFFYALENGTVGLYKAEKRIWRRRENGKCVGIVVEDFNSDDLYETLAAWDNGKVLLFESNSGKILLSFFVPSEISNIFFYEFLPTEKKKSTLLALSPTGSVFGFSYDSKNVTNFAAAKFVSKDKSLTPEELDEYESLLKQKEKLLEDLESLAVKESNKTKINSGKDELVLGEKTEVNIDLQSNDEEKCADLIIECSKGAYIKMVVILSEQLYPGESYIKIPKTETNKTTIQIKISKDMQINLHIKVFLTPNFYLPDSQVFEFNKIIPKYCFYILLRDKEDYVGEIKEGIEFECSERNDRLILFLELNFNIPKKELEQFLTPTDDYKIRFRSLRTEKIVEISSQKINGKKIYSILTSEIVLCGNILQDLAEDFKIKDLNTKVSFLGLAEKYKSVFFETEEFDRKRGEYNINVSESVNKVKDLFVKSEDSRMMGNMNSFASYISQISAQNFFLLGEFFSRQKNFENLRECLRKINELIVAYSRLKVGKFKVESVNKCRECIKKRNYKLLLKIVSTGKDD